MGRHSLLSPEQRADIKRRYLAGQAGEGPAISIGALASEYGTSVRPIREAIHGVEACRGGAEKHAPRSRGGPAALAAAAAPAHETEPAVPLPPIEAPATPAEVEPDMGALIRDLVDTGGLHEFMRVFWSTCVPQTFVDNWHLGAICEYLTDVALGKTSRLVINIPPGCCKSLSVGVFWPAWMWTLDPKLGFLFGSFDQTLLNNQQSARMIELITSPEYQAAYPYVKLAVNKPALREFKNTEGGLRFNTSPEGKGTGRHVDHLIVDDPMKPQDAISGGGKRKAAFDKVNNWFDGTLPTRVRKSITLIMQRLHTDDLAGLCLARGYESLILPMRMTKRAMWARDPRTEVGQLLWPEYKNEEKVRELELTLKNEASAQLQQDPTPAAGGIIEEPWTRLEWVDPPSKGRWCSSWDFSAKGTSEAHSKVAGQLWCATRCTVAVREYISELNERLAKVPGARGDVRLRVLGGGDRGGEAQIGARGEEYYLLVDWVGGLWNYVTSKSQFTMAHSRPLWKQHARIKLIELKANGIPLVEEFRDKFVGIKGIEPSGDKEERLRVHSEKFEAGQVIFCPGGDPVREELVKFPRFSYDDQVDAATQALDHLANKNARYRENLRRIAASGAGIGGLI